MLTNKGNAEDATVTEATSVEGNDVRGGEDLNPYPFTQDMHLYKGDLNFNK